MSSNVQILAILNATPDSFYKNSRTEKDFLIQVEKKLDEGADWLDIGGYSTRPGADFITEEIEIQRVIPIVSSIKKAFPDCKISLDTFRKKVAEHGVDNGVEMINDVGGGLFDSEMLPWIISKKLAYILMHNAPELNKMHEARNYDNIAKNILEDTQERVSELKKNQVPLILDPGFGFWKNINQNFQLFNQLEDLLVFEIPILIGISRKSMIWKSLETNPEEALNGTSVLHTIALMKGAKYLRVHDVKEAKECVKLVELTKAN